MRGNELAVVSSAERVLARLPEFAATAIVAFMTGALVENPRRVGKPLLFELDGYLNARRGAYRVVYRIDDDAKRVYVVRVDHRSDVYRVR